MSDEIGEISMYPCGADVIVEWRIPNFLSLFKKGCVLYQTPKFYLRGRTWRLGIRPNGLYYTHGSGHMDVQLWKCSPNSSIRKVFSLSLKTVNGGKEHEEHCTKLFVGDLDYHQIHWFIPRAELSRRQSELTPNGVLTVVCTMNNMSSGNATGPEQNSENACVEVCTQTEGKNEEEASNAEVNKSDASGVASSSNQAGPTKSKESVLKWIKENCKEASEGKKRKMEEENVLKWIEENCKETSKGKKRKMEEENNDRSLCQDLKKLLLEGLNHDLILKVGDKELRAHQDVLRARSQVFRSMLDHDMKEKNSGIIDIPDCDPLAMEQFLFYIYSGNVETLDQSNMLNLYYIADKYEMKGLKKECSDFIRESLSQANICDVIQLALNHSDSSLLESTTVYFSNNMLGIMHTVEWQVFLKENSTVANELLIKAVEKLSNVKS